MHNVLTFSFLGISMNIEKNQYFDYFRHTRKELIYPFLNLISITLSTSNQINRTPNCYWSKYSDYCWLVWNRRVCRADDIITCMTMNSIPSSRALRAFALCGAWCEVKPREYSVGCESSCMFLGELIRERSALAAKRQWCNALGYYSYRAYSLLMTASITIQLCRLNNQVTRRPAVYHALR